MISFRYLFQITIQHGMRDGYVLYKDLAACLQHMQAHTNLHAQAYRGKKAAGGQAISPYTRQRTAQKRRSSISGVPQSFFTKDVACLNIRTNTYAAR
jgi:hypothetical protein